MSDQPTLFENEEEWKEHWKGMPEFKQDDKRPYRTIFVHFKSEEDIKAFEGVVNQQITKDTKSIWYPASKLNNFETLKYR